MLVGLLHNVGGISTHCQCISTQCLHNVGGISEQCWWNFHTIQVGFVHNFARTTSAAERSFMYANLEHTLTLVFFVTWRTRHWAHHPGTMKRGWLLPRSRYVPVKFLNSNWSKYNALTFWSLHLLWQLTCVWSAAEMKAIGTSRWRASKMKYCFFSVLQSISWKQTRNSSKPLGYRCRIAFLLVSKQSNHMNL